MKGRHRKASRNQELCLYPSLGTSQGAAGRQQGIPELHGGKSITQRRNASNIYRATGVLEWSGWFAQANREPALLRRPFAAAQRGRSWLPSLRTASLQGCSPGDMSREKGRLPERLWKMVQREKTSLRNHFGDSERVGKLKLLLQNSFVPAVKKAADNLSPRCHRQHYKRDLYTGIKCFSAALLEYQAQTDCSIHSMNAFEYILVLNK